ncbi:hypothetical protein, partial [Pantoea dispersa]|uniref:hypothetical protein n=1 Tax=Pantoea dispersa TaxID=59814 RepID=UPI002116AD8D
MSHRFCGLIVGGIFVYLLGQIRCRRAAGCLRQIATRQTLNRRSRRLNPFLDIAAGAPECHGLLIITAVFQRFLIRFLFSRRSVGIRLVYVVFCQFLLTCFRRLNLPLRPGDISNLAAWFTDQLSRLQAFMLLLFVENRADAVISVLG